MVEKIRKMNEVERVEEIIFKHGGRQISKRELSEIQKKNKNIKKGNKNI
jgi:hypothetical protein